MEDKKKIFEYFKENRLPKPVTINFVGQWAHGYYYAVTCGVFKLRKYAVYFKKGNINSVRER